MKFTGVCLVTKNVVGLTEFYKMLLDTEGEGDAEHAVVHIDGANIAIFSVNGMENMAPQSMSDAGRGSVILGFEVENVDGEYDRIKKLGVEFIMLTTTHPWGLRSFWFRDPDGNIVDFFSAAP